MKQRATWTISRHVVHAKHLMSSCLLCYVITVGRTFEAHSGVHTGCDIMSIWYQFVDSWATGLDMPSNYSFALNHTEQALWQETGQGMDATTMHGEKLDDFLACALIV